MAYIDETYGKQLEEALRGLVSRPALGQPWFGFHESEVPVGVLLFTATTHSRVLYADFWKYIQDKNLVKTEEEWQSIYTEQGWCPFYSDGDGIDTFRMPSAPLYLHGAGTLSEAGQYIEAGLPNINGTLSGYDLTGPEIGTSTGALYVDSSITTVCGANVASDFTSQLVGFDASLSNPIYGNSDTVTPETSKMLFGVWAISAPQQPIPDATIEGIISELGVASNNALEAKNGLNGVVRSVNGVNADAVGNVNISVDSVVEESIGNQWYRKWKSGMVEQCLTVFVTANGVAQEFDLLVPMTGYWSSIGTIERRGDEEAANMSVYTGRSDDNSKLVVTIDRYPGLNNYSFYVFIYASGFGA